MATLIIDADINNNNNKTYVIKWYALLEMLYNYDDSQTTKAKKGIFQEVAVQKKIYIYIHRYTKDKIRK